MAVRFTVVPSSDLWLWSSWNVVTAIEEWDFSLDLI